VPARRAARLALCVLLLAAATVPVAAQSSRPRWDTRVLATVPAPGYPAFAYVHPNGRIYEGTYDNPYGDPRPSRVFEYAADGTMLRFWTVPGQVLSGPHGVQVATSDARGRLVLLDLTPARALILDPATGTFTTYATFADLPACSPGERSTSCTPTLRDQPAEPDYAAWGADGSMYVTDYQQALIWRVPPGGGAARVWLADRRLDGDLFGTAGIVLSADHQSLLFTQGSSMGLSDGNPSTGKLYSVAIEPNGSPGPIQQLWESRSGDLPDGLAIAQSGHIYIALVGLPNQLVELASDGSELERFPAVPFTGANGSPEPFDNPSSAKFLGTSLIVPNQSYLAANPKHWTLLDVETGERGLAEFIPANAGASVRATAGAASSVGAATASLATSPASSGPGLPNTAPASPAVISVLMVGSLCGLAALARRRRHAPSVND